VKLVVLVVVAVVVLVVVAVVVMGVTVGVVTVVVVVVVVVVGGSDVAEWDFGDLQRYLHHQHPYHHSQEIVVDLLVVCSIHDVHHRVG